MKIKISVFVFLFTCSLFSTHCSLSWGVWAHYRINMGGVLCMPDTPGAFLYHHADYITEESVVPDVRKHDLNDRAESIRHFIDLEGLGDGTIAGLPHTYAEAVKKFTTDTLKKYGTLPWTILEHEQMLTRAFRDGNKAEILFLAADLGHYVGDAHMPLHTSINHDGQLTGQKGIHGLWEAELPELFGSAYHLYSRPAEFLPDITEAVFAALSHSHSLVDSLLHADQRLRNTFPESTMFMHSDSGQVKKNKYGQQVFSKEYAQKFHSALNGMVELQMKAALMLTADLWYTAWVNAGRPDLSQLDSPIHAKEDFKQFIKDKGVFRNNSSMPLVQTADEYSFQ